MLLNSCNVRFQTHTFFYRCLRDLGADLSLDTSPNPIAEIMSDGLTINLTNLDKNSIRSYKTTVQLLSHHERELHNLSRRSFKLDTIHRGTGNWEDLMNDSPCPEG